MLGRSRPPERHEIIDIIRGFALFGVLVANWVLVTQFKAMTEEQRQALPTATWDEFASFMTGVFIGCRRSATDGQDQQAITVRSSVPHGRHAAPPLPQA